MAAIVWMMVLVVLARIQSQTLVVIAMETDKELPVVAAVANDRQILHHNKDVLCGRDQAAAVIIRDFAPDVRTVPEAEQNIIVIRRMKAVAEDVVLLQVAAEAAASRPIPQIV